MKRFLDALLSEKVGRRCRAAKYQDGFLCDLWFIKCRIKDQPTDEFHGSRIFFLLRFLVFLRPSSRPFLVQRVGFSAFEFACF